MKNLPQSLTKCGLTQNNALRQKMGPTVALYVFQHFADFSSSLNRGYTSHTAPYMKSGADS
jgi:hypothetical protein